MNTAMARTRLAVTGGSGRMGRKVLEVALASPDLDVVSVLVLPEDPWAGRELGDCLHTPPLGVQVSGNLEYAFKDVDVVVDFTTPEALSSFLPEVARSGAALVSGTTGLSATQSGDLEALSKNTPVVFAPNMSLGVNLLFELVKLTVRTLGPDFDFEILEVHHRRKEDAPSGTALALARSCVDAHGEPPEVTLRSAGRIGPRPGSNEVGVGVLRGGDVVGDHTAFFLGTGERLEITHRASDRMAFAQGAVRATRWVAEKPPGFYTMQDVLGLNG